MSTDDQLRQRLLSRQGRLSPEVVKEVRTLFYTFGRRDGEDEQDYLLRLERQNAEYIARVNREEDDENREAGRN